MLGLKIHERMAGHIRFFKKSSTNYGGRELEINTNYPFEINIHTFCKSLNYPFPFDFKGYAYFPGIPLPANRPEKMSRPLISGKMGISHRGVSYNFSLDLAGIGNLDLDGAKKYNYTLNWIKFRKSLVTLPLTVKKDGEIIGEGELVYQEPLYIFPTGIKITTQKRAFHSLGRLPQQLLSFAPLFISEDCPSDSLGMIKKQLNNLPRWGYWFLKLLSFVLNIFILFVYRKFPRNLTAMQKENFSNLFTSSRIINLTFFPIMATIFNSVFSSQSFREKKDQNIPIPPSTVEEEPWMQLNLTPTIQNSKEDFEVDVVVVGAGAAGGALAYELARKGHAVAIVEEGHYFKRPDFTGDRFEMMHNLYRNQGINFALSSSSIWLPTGRCVGGTTTINSGTCFRTPDHVIERWGEELGLTNLGLENYFSQVEEMLNTKAVPEDIRGGISNILNTSLKNQNYQHYPLRRAEEGCDGQSYCILGCPTSAKRSTDTSYVKEALRNNAYLFSRYKVKEILRDGDKATGVRARLEGYGEEFSLTIKAKKVVLAAGSLQTPKLLSNLGLKKTLPQLGKNLTIHPALTLGALFPAAVREKLFVPQSMGVSSKYHPDFILEGYTLPSDTIPLVFSNYGKELQRVIDNINNFTNFSAMIKDPVKGKLILFKNAVIPQYFINKRLQRVLRDASVLLGEIFFDAGANTVYAPIIGHNRINSKEELYNLNKKLPSSFRYNLSAYHPLGTCQMGSSPNNSVVNFRGEVWGMKNLIVADGSSIPGPLGVNPQVTIMANALRIANLLEEKLV